MLLVGSSRTASVKFVFYSVGYMGFCSLILAEVWYFTQNKFQAFNYISSWEILIAASLMTVVQDQSESSSCPVTPLTDHSYGNHFITIMDRNTELAVMDNDINTCLDASIETHRVFRLVSYIYVTPSVLSLRVVLMIYGLSCTKQGLVSYYRISTDEHDIHFQECISTGMNDKQQCEFTCHNICPDEPIVMVYVQLEKMPKDIDFPVNICGMTVVPYSLDLIYWFLCYSDKLDITQYIHP